MFGSQTLFPFSLFLYTLANQKNVIHSQILLDEDCFTKISDVKGYTFFLPIKRVDKQSGCRCHNFSHDLPTLLFKSSS